MTEAADAIAVIIPVKPLARAKSRLRALGAARPLLVRAMLADVLAAAQRARVGPLYVLSSDPAFDDLAARYAAKRLPDAARGYNGAVAAALATAEIAAAGAAIVLPADLPAVRPADIRAVARHLRRSQVVLAASNDGGTAALGLRPPGVMRPAFGRASAVAHHRRATVRGLCLVEVSRPGLAVDVDTVADLDAIGAPLGRATAALMRALRSQAVPRPR